MVKNIDDIGLIRFESLSDLEREELKLLGLSKFRHRLSLHGKPIYCKDMTPEIREFASKYLGKRISGNHPSKSYLLHNIISDGGYYRFFCYDCPRLDP